MYLSECVRVCVCVILLVYMCLRVCVCVQNLKGLNVTKDFTSIPPYFPLANLISAEHFAKIVWGWMGDDGPFKFFLRNPIFREALCQFLFLTLEKKSPNVM